jgi:FG-GAP-like repeat/FG-GAP repeat
VSTTQGLCFNDAGRTVGQILNHKFPKSVFLIVFVLGGFPFVASAVMLPIQFAPPINLNLGSTVDRLCAADFNGDGFLDLAVTYGNGIGILTNDGTGTMRLWTNFNAYGALGAGDFNGDHKMDLVTVALGSVGKVWLNNGNGSFTATNFNSPFTIGNAVAVGDFNADQKLDLAVSLTGVSIFLGQGNGGFAFLTNYNVGGTAIAVADFDSNARIDLLTIQYSSSLTTVLSGNGNGTFAPPVNYYDATFYRNCVATGDFNRDAKPDIVVGNTEMRSITVR